MATLSSDLLWFLTWFLIATAYPSFPEIRHGLGLAGTMAGSVGSIAEQDYDGSDPDSDILDALQVIWVKRERIPFRLVAS